MPASTACGLVQMGKYGVQMPAFPKCKVEPCAFSDEYKQVIHRFQGSSRVCSCGKLTVEVCMSPAAKKRAERAG